MPRYIDADWIVDKLADWRDKLAETYGNNDEYVLCLGEVLMKIVDTPTADVVERKRGKKAWNMNIREPQHRGIFSEEFVVVNGMASKALETMQNRDFERWAKERQARRKRRKKINL